MSKESYIIKFNDIADYENHKDKLVASSEYDTIEFTTSFWVLHYLTEEEYEKIKSHGINITYDIKIIR